MSDTAEPARKKRRSKWGIKPEDVESTPQGPKGAEAAAAKINAMLAAQGKLAKAEPPLMKSAKPLFSSSSGPSSGLLSTPPIPPNASLAAATSGHSGHYIQDKIFIGLGNAPSTFNVKEKLEGPGGSFLSHIASQTRAKIFLRGQGSGNIEPTSKRESFEALHIYISHSNQSGMDSACKLCESLIDTVKTELDSFMAAQQTQQPLGYGGNASYASGPEAPYVNPYQHPYGHPGGYGPPAGPPGPPMGHPGPFPPGPPSYPVYALYQGPDHYQGPDYPGPPPHHPPPGYGHYPPPPHTHNPNYPPQPLPPAPYPNSGVPPPHPQAYYGAPPPSPYPPVPAAIQQHQQQLPPEPEFQRHDKEPAKRKFKEAPIPVSSTDGPTAADTNYFSLNKNTGSSDSLPAKNGEIVAGKRKESGETNTSGRTFKESPTISVRRFEEGPSQAPSPAINGETRKIVEADSAKWKSLSVSTVSVRKGESGKDESTKEEATKDKGGDADLEERHVFARPTVRPSELARRMSMPGKELLHQGSKLSKTMTESVASQPAALIKAVSVASEPLRSKMEDVAKQNNRTRITVPKAETGLRGSARSRSSPESGTKPLSLVSYSSEDSDSDADL